MEKIGTQFRRSVKAFADMNEIPMVRFNKGDRKIEVMGRYLDAQAKTGRSGVAAIGVAQEYQNVFASTERSGINGLPWFSFTKADRRVTCFYFYLWDMDFGPGFIKVCAYFPYPVKVWVNGHEWAKRQASHAGIRFTELSNGFATCADPEGLQAICDRLGPRTIGDFFNNWMSRLPLPLTDPDRAAGYWWELSMRQIEVSRTLVFDAPRRARAFFEALVSDNLDIGRPDSVELIFTGPRHRRSAVQARLRPQDQVVTRDTDVTVNAFFKHSRVKQYLKDGRALRIETVVNSPDDLRCHRRLAHLDELQTKARDVNRRLLDTERVGQGCVLASPAFERVAQSVGHHRRPEGPSPAVRRPSGHGPARRPVYQPQRPRIHQPEPSCPGEPSARRGLHRQPDELRPWPATPQRPDRTLPHTNTYILTPDGQRVAIFYTKVHDRLLRPLLAADQPPAPTELRTALATIDRQVHSYIDHARIAKAA